MAAAVLAMVWLSHSGRGPAQQSADATGSTQSGRTSGVLPASSVSASSAAARLADRKQMSRDSRLQYLERLGQIPEDADSTDWSLAQQTSWWGKPIPATNFWSNRVVWLDHTALGAANRHGRALPPIPDSPKMPGLEIYPTNDISGPGSSEGPYIAYHLNSAENGFWDWFNRHYPVPPEVLEQKVLDVGDRFITASKLPNLSPKELADYRMSIKRGPLDLNYPPEAFSDEALLASYILDRRREYESLVREGDPPGSGRMTSFMKRLAVDPKLITDPVNPDLVAAATSWKTAYVARLRKEGADKTYIDAYRRAWGLSPTDQRAK